jgi:segregation and condensation protein A
MAYEIHLAAFDGPFDLLLHLIQKNEVDIYDIPIAEITEQYLDYLNQMEALDLDIASEFLVMAATLLSIKARMLLPKPPPELLDEDESYDPRLQLVRDLLEYKRIKEAADRLEEYYNERQLQFARPNDESMYSSMFSEVNPLEGKTLADLAAAFQPVWQRAKSAEKIHTIRRESVSIGMMTNRLVDRLKAAPGGIRFTDIFDENASRVQVIVAFLALLELAKISAVRMQQDKPESEIYIMPADLSAYDYEDFDANFSADYASADADTDVGKS